MSTTTRIKAKDAIDAFIADYISPTSVIESDTTEIIVTAITDFNDPQFRDYLMGLPVTFPLDTVRKCLAILSAFVPDGKQRAIYSVLAQFAWEAGDDTLAETYLTLALNEDAGYSLANLLKRVFATGWERESFVTMRTQLHPKVIEALDDTVIGR